MTTSRPSQPGSRARISHAAYSRSNPLRRSPRAPTNARTGRPSFQPLRSRIAAALDGVGRMEPGRVGAEIDRLDPIGGDADVLDQVPPRQLRIRDRQRRLTQRRTAPAAR